MRETLLHNLADYERSEKFQRHYLRETAFVEFQLWSDNYHGTTGVIHPLTKQILSESALLALKHIREGTKRTAARGELLRTEAGGIIDKRVNRLLQHPLLVADDNVRRLYLQKFL